jgi:Concanavalin A-like lectin/glucanases superfamily
MKISLISCLSIFVLLLSCKKEKEQTARPEEQLDPLSGKVYHYLFNGNRRDTVCRCQHAGESSTLTYVADRFGRAGRAIHFTGLTTFETNGLKMTFPFTVSFWMRTPTPAANTTLFKSEREPAPIDYTGYWFQTFASGPYTMGFSFGDGTGSGASARNSILSSKTLTPNQWHHIVITVTGANSMELYINGVKDNATIYDGGAVSMVYAFPDPIGIVGQGFSGQFFAGDIDDLKLYNRILTAAEISSLYSFTP